jgi:hypothetical protein
VSGVRLAHHKRAQKLLETCRLGETLPVNAPEDGRIMEVLEAYSLTGKYPAAKQHHGEFGFATGLMRVRVIFFMLLLACC